MRYYARLNPAKVEEGFLHRKEVQRLSDAGAQAGSLESSWEQP